MTACRWMPLPLAAYMRRVMLPLTPAKRRVVIYDQLNPAYAKYYTRQEAHDAARPARVPGHPPSSSPRVQLDRDWNAAVTPRQHRRARLQRGGDAAGVHRPSPRRGGRTRRGVRIRVHPGRRRQHRRDVGAGATADRRRAAAARAGAAPQLRPDRGAAGGPFRRARRRRDLDGFRPAALPGRPAAVPEQARGRVRSGLRLAARAARRASSAAGRPARRTC